MKRWINIKKQLPEANVLVDLAHMVSGIGAPEREGWISEGRLRPSGIWSIKYCARYSYNLPITHWRPK